MSETPDVSQVQRLAEKWAAKLSLAESFGCDEGAEEDADWAKVEFIAALNAIFRKQKEDAARIQQLEVALEWIKGKTADKRNPAVAFVCEKLLRGEGFSPLREDGDATEQG